MPQLARLAKPLLRKFRVRTHGSPEKAGMSSAPVSNTSVSNIGQRARRRIARRLLPFLLLLYIIAFLDRVNVAYAALEMSHDLGFSDRVFGFGAGIFFIGYVLLEIPGALIVERWSA